MNLKEIFKPTIGKIIIAGILFIIFIPFIESDEIMCLVAPCPDYGTQSLLESFLIRTPVSEINYTNFIAGIIFSYFASCFFLFCINKLGNKIKSQP